jgi:hypothetical protein
MSNNDTIEVIQNFDWDITNRKLCVFMPNYHNPEYTKFSIQQIKTEVPTDDYVVIVGNDNVDVSFEEFEKDNVFFFTLKREEVGMRNGCFIRNYALKRCQSSRFLQKDGEVVILGDFVKNCLEWKTPWRAGNIYVLTDPQTRNYMKSGNTKFIDNPTHKVRQIFPESADIVKDMILKANGGLNLSTYFHYAYCADTSVLKDISGYDEDFTYYGFEDSDMFCRLYSLGHRIIPDHSCSAVHLCHPRNDIDIPRVERMKEIYTSKTPGDVNRNPGGWGDGL